MQNQIKSEEIFYTELTKFSSIEDLENNLNRLIQLDKSELSQEEIRKLIFDHAIILPNHYSVLPKEVINKLTVFRVRAEKTMDLEKEDLNLIRTYSYPNSANCLSNGRANIKYKTVFYCSDNQVTALAESNLEIGDIAYLGVWKTFADRDANYATYISTNIPAKNVWYNKGVDIHKQSTEYAKKYSNDKFEYLVRLQNFFSEIFLTEKKPYSLSSWVANNLLYGYNIVDFIVYPSFGTNHYSCNMAMHPNYVENNLKLDCVFKLLITGKTGESINFNVQKFGKLSKTSIIWKIPEQDEIYEYFPNATLQINGG
jgi:hypothetical protein